MIGYVDEYGRALVPLTIQRDSAAKPIEIEAWIDTAFNGELVIPTGMIQAAQLEQSGGIEAKLADGNAVMLESFSCLINWFGEDRFVEVVANEGDFPLLGIALLIGCRLAIDYDQLSVTID